ncbi:hypothetical protein EV715DRAFT_295123 [Schizophyllum commune]
MSPSSFDHTFFGNKQRHSGHSYGGKPDDWDLAFIMDASYSPKPYISFSTAYYVDADGEMHDPDYRPFALPPSPPIIRQTTTEAYEEQLDADRRGWLSGRAQSPIRSSIPKPSPQESWQTPVTRPRSSTTSSTSSCTAVRRALRLHKPHPRADSPLYDEEYSHDVFYEDQLSSPEPQDTETDAESSDEELCEQAHQEPFRLAEHLRQKMLAAHLGMQFSVIRTERRLKKSWAKTKKVHMHH